MTSAREFFDKVYSGDTPEEILAGKIAAHAAICNAGTRLPGGKTPYPHEKGKFQIKDDRRGVVRGDFFVPIWVGADDIDECKLLYKQALIDAARELMKDD